MNSKFWKNKKIFITGHTGFKGSWLSLWLQQLGAEVTGYSLMPPTEPNLYSLAKIELGLQSFIGDIGDLNLLKKTMSEAKPEIVFHLAAQALVRKSYSNPLETYATNVMGTVHLFEAIRGCPTIKAVVNVTSDKCYENNEWYWGYRETEPMGGFDPYSNSKGCVELITSAYRKSFFNQEKGSNVKLASARAGNVIGGGDWAQDRLIPDILRAISEGNDVIIRSPQAVRPWQHVLEPLSGYLMLAERLYENNHQYDEGWNFGPNDIDAKPVQWIVENLTRKWGGDCKWKNDSLNQPHEAHYLKLDCSKARQKLGWLPKWNLEKTLQLIVDWQKAYLMQQDMREYTLEQIKEYTKA